MKKVLVLMILGILLVSLVGNLVLAANENSNQNANQNGGDETENQGLGQTIRNQVKAGVYTSESGEQIRVSEMAQNRIKLQVNGVEAECDCNMTQEQAQNKTRLKVQLSNGRNAEIKVMPDAASETALSRLRLKTCNSENNCSIELKEVPVRNEKQLAYEVQVQRHMRILGMFRTKAQVKAQIDAESGEVIQVKKPWWAFLATEPED